MELNLNKVPPTEEPSAVVENKPEEKPIAAPPVNQVQAEPPKAEPPKTDEFIERFNKEFGTQYKAKDELKTVFELPTKIKEYETRLSEYESIKQSAEEKQKKIEELESLNDPLKWFSSQDAYRAEQLRIKHPDKDPFLLQEIAMTDVDKMDDFDLLAKAEKLFNRNLPEGGKYVKDVLLKRYGIDADTNPSEWDGATKTQIAMDANVVRSRINELKKGIELPKVVTAEERERARADSLAKRTQALTPVKDQFTKFDKFQLDGFEYEVPSDYKSKASELFDGMFIDAGLEMNEENLKTALQLRDQSFLYENFSKIKEVIAKQAQTSVQAVVDKELHSDTLPNTATRTDQVPDENQLPGIGKLISSLGKR